MGHIYLVKLLEEIGNRKRPEAFCIIGFNSATIAVLRVGYKGPRLLLARISCDGIMVAHLVVKITHCYFKANVTNQSPIKTNCT